MPKRCEHWGKTWVERNPGWELRTWTEADLSPLRNQICFDAAASYAQRSDIARYEILERYGGVYIDADFECLRPIDPLLEGLSFFGALQAGSTVSNGVFGASPHHPVLKAAVHRLHASFIGRASLGIPEQTGPEFFTRSIEWAAARARPDRMGSHRIYEPAFFFPYLHSEPWLAGGNFPLAYAVHHWSNIEMWVEPDETAERTAPVSRRSSRWPEDLRERAGLAPGALREHIAAKRYRLEPVARRRVRSTLNRIVERWRALALPAERPRAVFLGNGRLLVETTWGSRLVVPADDLSLTPYLALSGAYEGNFAAFLTKRLRHGDTVIDVGANIGLFTVLMAELVGRGGRVYSYECNPRAFEHLTENVQMNWLDERVVALPVAAGRDERPVSFAVPRSLLMLGTTRLDRDIGHVDEITVACERIDRRIDPGVRVELVKIDVEGAEVDVIAGLSGLLEERRIGTLVIELGYDRQGARWDEMRELLTDLFERRGAAFSALDDRGELLPQSLLEVLTIASYGNLVIELTPPGTRA